MKFKINHIEYEVEENNVKLIDFLKNNKIKYIDNSLFKIEVENEVQLKNLDDITIEDNMSLLTISNKIIEQLNFELQSIDINSIQDEVLVSKDDYNILLCDPDIYEDCLKLYSRCGFDDIINIKFASMIEFIEKANEMLNKKAKEIDRISQKPIVYSTINVINYENAVGTNVLPSEDIACLLINSYYKKICNIAKNINVVYITNSIYKYLNNSINRSKVNQTILFNHAKLIENSAESNNIISKSIYLKNSSDFTKNCSFIGYIKLFRQMGLKENRLESISIDDDSKKITGIYQKVSITGLITKKFPNVEEVEKYDYIYILADNEELDYLNEEDYLVDYNVNEIYKMFLIKPGNNFIKRK